MGTSKNRELEASHHLARRGLLPGTPLISSACRTLALMSLWVRSLSSTGQKSSTRATATARGCSSNHLRSSFAGEFKVDANGARLFVFNTCVCVCGNQTVPRPVRHSTFTPTKNMFQHCIKPYKTNYLARKQHFALRRFISCEKPPPDVLYRMPRRSSCRHFPSTCLSDSSNKTQTADRHCPGSPPLPRFARLSSI